MKLKPYIIILVIVIFSLQNSYTQELYWEHLEHGFLEGDTIMIGYPLYDSGPYGTVATYTNQRASLAKKNLYLNKFVVDEVITPESGLLYKEINSKLNCGKPNIIGMHNIDDNTKYYICLSDAFLCDEIIIGHTNNEVTDMYYLNYGLGFSLFNKFRGVSISDFAMEYMLCYKENLLKESKNDEFVLQKNKSIIEKEIQEQYNISDTAKEFLLNVDMRLGDYDFDKNYFPLEYNKMIITSYKRLNYLLEEPIWTRSFNINLINADKFSTFPIDENMAQKYIESKKDIFGKINRKTYATFNVKIKGYRTQKLDNEIPLMGIQGDNILDVEIVGISLYSHKSREYNLIYEK